MSFYDAIRVGASGAADFEIERSLRFNDNDGASLTRTQSTSPTNAKKGTLSFWLKRANIENNQHFYNVYADDNNRGIIYFRSDTSNLQIGNQSGGTFYSIVRLNRRFVDPSAWYHIVIAFDTTQGTAADRIKVYVNGSQETSFHTANYPSQNDDIIFFNQANVKIGAAHDNQANEYFDGYASEFNYIDGQQLTPSSFGETNSDTGQWVPKKYAGSYGTNGFRLNFSDNSGTTATTLGKDLSGNGNNFTPNNFSVAAGVGNDSLEDTPTNNFATLNSLKKPTNGALSNGNLDGSGNSSDWVSFFSTILVSSGKWFCEVKVNATRVGVGIAKDGANENSYLGSAADTYAYYDLNGKWNNGSNTSYGATYTTNDIIGIALDMDAGTLIFYKNGASQGTAFTGLSGEFALGFSVYGGSANASINYGQRAFDYTVPTGYKALNSANLPDPTILFPNKHFDTLLWTANASTQVVTGLNFQPDWVWGKSRDDTYDHEVYDSVRGPLKRLKPNSTSQELTNAGNLQSFNSAGGGTSGGFTLGSATNMNYNSGSDIVGWNWNAGDTDSATYRVVVVSDSGNKYRFRNSANSATFAQSAVTLDLAEGGTYTFDGSDSTMASHPIKLSTTSDGTHGGGSSYNTGVTYELDGSTVTESAYVSGYSSATSRKLIITVAASAPTLYYYCHVHSGMGGQANTNSTLGSSNFDGSTQTIVKANTTAGFSIVSYSGNDTSGSTIGHGLGAVPQITIIKRRIAAEDWMFGIGHILGSGKEGHYIKLNATESEGTGNGPFASTNSSSTVVTIGSDVAVNDNGEPYICYCFSEVAGYSKFGLYTGNGSTDGTFIFTGFRPAFFMCKAISFTKGWRMTDSKRAPFNRIFASLFPELTAAEYTATGTSNQGQDFLSNGVKLRSTNTRDNQSGSTYFFMAFAESPFKNSRAR